MTSRLAARKPGAHQLARKGLKIDVVIDDTLMVASCIQA